MDKAQLTNLNELIYRIYDEDNFLSSSEIFLKKLQEIIPFAYASIILKDIDSRKLKYTDIYCYPKDFLYTENKCIPYYNEKSTIPDTSQSVVLCHNRDSSDISVLYSPVYKLFYKKLHISDILKLHISCNGTYLGMLTLYRTIKMTRFTEDETFLIQMLSLHFEKYYYKAMVEDDIGDRIKQRAQLLEEEYELTPREGELLPYILKGYTEDEITRKFCISLETFRNHMHSIYKKLSVSCRWELSRFV